MTKVSSGCTSAHKVPNRGADQTLGFRSPLPPSKPGVSEFLKAPYPSPRPQTCSEPFNSTKEQLCGDRGFGVLWKITMGSGNFLLKSYA